MLRSIVCHPVAIKPSACTVFLHQPGKVVCVQVLQPFLALPHTDQAARGEVLQVWQVAPAKALVTALLEPAKALVKALLEPAKALVMAQTVVLAPRLNLVIV